MSSRVLPTKSIRLCPRSRSRRGAKRNNGFLDLQEELENFTKAETEQLSSILATQTSQYMVAAWRVTGKPKMTVDEAADKDHLDPEMLDRWVKFLAQPPKFYPFLKDWQAMIAAGGKEEDEAKALADAFQDLVLRVGNRPACNQRTERRHQSESRRQEAFPPRCAAQRI